ncbi:MAG TPA: acetate--CoA ligase family protein [Acetomicrobium flavidum]|uniref:acetate--CoA ligase family protein n=1 Tax=Acetomicrobium flavidum TaxID=49896 RepID=UPI002BC9E909|nr:acetate--CoA ligase family protein [Acetomicrobium flavidum]
MSSYVDLGRLFRPKNIAIVGASSNLDSISGRPLKLLNRYNYKGGIFPVNPKYDSLHGFVCYPDVRSLPVSPDVVIIGVRANLVPDILEQCGEKNVPFVVIFSSGFAEADDPFLQEKIVSIAKKWNIRIVGPNCQGLVNFVDGVPLSFSASLDGEPLKPGNIAYVSQSGAFGFASFALSVDSGVNFRYVVTTGNQVDLDVVDFGRYIIEDKEVKLLILYLEGLEDGSKFLDLVQRAKEREIPVAVLKVGRSEVAKKAAKSHTAALTGDKAVWDAVFKQYGVISISDVEDIIDLGTIFSSPKRARGKNVAVLTTSGGAGIIMTDLLDDFGLEVPILSPEIQEKIKPYIPPFGSCLNPVDMTAQVINDPKGFPGCLDAVLECPDIDMVTVIISMITGESGRQMTEDLIAANKHTIKPINCSWLIDNKHGEAFLRQLKAEGIPLFQSLRRSAFALSALGKWNEVLSKPTTEIMVKGSPYLPNLPFMMTEYDSKRLLAYWGVPVTKERLCLSLEEALDASEEIGYPVALKVMSPQILHKTEAGAVALNLNGEEQIRNAYGRILENARKHCPDAQIEGVLVQEMVSDGLECMIGIKRDPIFGPIIVVGLGGIYVEVLKDVSMRRAPIDENMAYEMIGELKGYPLLAGARGQKRKDVKALAEVVSLVSKLACIENELEELDINPIFVLDEGKGVLVADALVLRKAKE